MYGVAIRILLKHRFRKNNMQATSRIVNNSKLVICAVTLGSVLGLTWILGFFYMTDGKLIQDDYSKFLRRKENSIL